MVVELVFVFAFKPGDVVLTVLGVVDVATEAGDLGYGDDPFAAWGVVIDVDVWV